MLKQFSMERNNVLAKSKEEVEVEVEEDDEEVAKLSKKGMRECREGFEQGN